MAEKDEALSKWVQPEVSEQRVQRMWSAIDEADRRRGWPRWAIFSVAVSGALAVALVVSVVTRPTALVAGAQVVAAAEPRVARFADGSTAELGPSSSLTLIEQREGRVEVKLHAGRATFEVSKRPAREFVVRAGEVRVRVVGTRFTVSDHGEQVDVSVERGVVEVTRADETQRLTAGQSWHSTELAAAEEDVEVEDDAAVSPTAAPAVKRVKRTRRHAAAVAAPVAVTPAAPAEDLFQTALTARREGRTADAAKGFERFVRESSADPRAAVAAFELGRIRMDTLGDTRGALEALRRSLQLDGKAAFREEAMSRVVRAFDQLGDTASCAQARDAYLAAFPQGAYAHGMQTRCAEPTR